MKHISSSGSSQSYLSHLPEIIPRELLFGEQDYYNPQISPDGTKLSYLALKDNEIKLCIKTPGKDDDRAIASLKKRGAGLYYWTSDKYIVYLYDETGMEHWKLYKVNIENNESKLLTPDKHSRIGLIHNDREAFPDEVIFSISTENNRKDDLYHINLNSDKVTLIAQNPGNVIRWLIDNSFTVRGMIAVKDDGTAELLIKEEDNSVRSLVNWSIKDSLVSQPCYFTGDNRYIYLEDSSNSNTSTIIKVEIKTGKTELVVSDKEYDIYTSKTLACDQSLLVMNSKTLELEAVAVYKFRKEWIFFNNTIEEDFKAIEKIDRGDISIVSADTTDNTWIVEFVNDNRPVSYYSFNKKTKENNFLFYNKPLLNDYTMSPMEEITFKSRDNLIIHGYITYPPGIKRKNLPLVLAVHAGPWYRDMWGYNPTAQWLSNRGYVCLQINYRGSIGYGRDFLNAGNKEWGGKMQDDLIDSVNWAIEKGIADPARIAIYGSGYGGYAALAGATFTPDLFCCAIAIQCPTNLITFLGSVSTLWSNYGEIFLKRVGDPDKDRDLLISRSPFYKLEKIKIPILIAYGLNNTRVKSSEPYKMVHTIKSKGISVEHLVFPDEGHNIIKQENRLKLYAVAEKFLASHLGGRYEARDIYVKDIYISTPSDKRKYEGHIIDKISKEGDICAFEELIDSYRTPLFKYLIKLTRDAEASRELLHETFSRVWLYMNSYTFMDNIPFAAWLYKVATHVAYRYRIKKSRLDNEISLEEMDLALLTEQYEENIEDKIFIHSSINSLKEPYKTAVFLRFIKDLNYKDIASLMNTDQNNIKIYLHRAKKEMKKLLNNS